MPSNDSLHRELLLKHFPEASDTITVWDGLAQVISEIDDWQPEERTTENFLNRLSDLYGLGSGGQTLASVQTESVSYPKQIHSLLEYSARSKQDLRNLRSRLPDTPSDQ